MNQKDRDLLSPPILDCNKCGMNIAGEQFIAKHLEHHRIQEVLEESRSQILTERRKNKPIPSLTTLLEQQLEKR